MPELPEVETIRRILLPQVHGQQILSVQIRNSQVIAYPNADAFIIGTAGRTIIDFQRRGKFLILCLDNGSRIFLHLRMTGQLLLMPDHYPEEKHTHVILQLPHEQQLRYIDVRRFGRFWLIPEGESPAVTGIEKLGLEPTDPQLTAAFLQNTLGSISLPIKEMLNRQQIISGIGNIYSDEILYDCRLHPATFCTALTTADFEHLADAIPRIITWGIDADAMTPEEYLAGKGKEYRNSSCLKAYGRAGKPCLRCGTVMEKTEIRGRSAAFCPACQQVRI